MLYVAGSLKVASGAHFVLLSSIHLELNVCNPVGQRMQVVNNM